MMEEFEIPVLITKIEKLKIKAMSLEEAKKQVPKIIKGHFEFLEIEDAEIE